MNTKRTPDLDDLTPDQRERLLQFKGTHGRTWKSDLLDMWLNGKDATLPGGHLLRQIRNQQGPVWLNKLVI